MVAALSGILPTYVKSSATNLDSNTEGSQSSLKGRVCFSWRMIPGIILLAVCIIGVVASLIYNSPYLAIPFGIGGLASFGVIHMGHQFRHLKSLGERVNELQVELVQLTEHNERLSASLETLDGSLAQLQQENTQYGQRNVELGGHISDLRSENTELSTNVSDLRGEIQSLQTKNEEHHTKMSRANELLSTLVNSASGNNEVFAETLGLLQELSGEWGDNQSALGDLVRHLTTVTSALNEEFVQSQVAMQNQLQSDVSSLRGLVVMLEEQKATLVAQKETLEFANTTLRTSLSQLGESSKDIGEHAEVIRQATPMMRQISQTWNSAGETSNQHPASAPADHRSRRSSLRDRPEPESPYKAQRGAVETPA